MMWYYLLLAVIVCGLAVLIYLWPRGGVYHTFSYHAASSRNASIFYIALFVIALPPFVYWYVNWAVPMHNLPIVSGWFMTGAALFQIAAACVPERGKYILAHRILTGLSVASMFGVAVLLLASNSDIYVGLCLAIMVIIAAYAFSKKDEAKYQLLLQAGMYTAFFSSRRCEYRLAAFFGCR